MIVAADTTPLPYLAVLGEIEVLSRLFGEVLCPPEVLAECRHPHAPAALQRWAAELPRWLIVRDAPDMEVEGLRSLDAGEAAVIRLALHLRADAVLMDERKGRRIATAAGLVVTGSLAILAEAAVQGWLDFDSTVERLRSTTNFRVADAVVAQVRARIFGGA